MVLRGRKVSPRPGQRLSESPSPSGLATSEVTTNPSATPATTSEELRREVVPAVAEDEGGIDTGRRTSRPASGGDTSDSEYESIFALRAPAVTDVIAQGSQPKTSRTRKSMRVSLSATTLVPTLTTSGADAPPGFCTSVISCARPGEPDEPTQKLGERGNDNSDTMSDVVSNSEMSIVETPQAFHVVAPFSPQLLSVLVTMKEEIVDCIRPRLQSMITSDTHGTHQHPTGQPSSSRSPASGLHSARGLGPSRKYRQRRNHDDDSHDSGADDGDNEETEKQALASDHGLHPKRRFACIFLKRFPESKSLTGACHGPGWVSVHRIKEHIFRAHRQSVSSCPRCRNVFDTDKHLALHLQEETSCELNTPFHEEEVLFITQEQERQLKKRTRNTVDEERWIQLFRVVFPDVPIDRVPSPYHEAVTSLSSSELAILPKFRALLLTELPPRFSRNVARVLQSRGMISSEIEKDVAEVCRRTIHEVSNEILSLLQVISPSLDQAQSSEATSSPPLSPPSTSSAQLAPSTLSSTVGDLMQNSFDFDAWFQNFISTSDSSFTEEWETIGPLSNDLDAGTEMLNLAESNGPDATDVDSSLYR